jgi:hypothetical protein
LLENENVDATISCNSGRNMDETPNNFLMTGAALSALAALAHAGCIAFGAPWYRAMGAGERMTRMALAGSWRPAIVTAFIATVLATWSLYALSGAGIIPRLPLLRTALCLITGVYLLRGVAGFPLMFHPLGRGMSFWLWSSAICLAIGAVHLIGLRQVWPRL